MCELEYQHCTQQTFASEWPIYITKMKDNLVCTKKNDNLGGTHFTFTKQQQMQRPKIHRQIKQKFALCNALSTCNQKASQHIQICNTDEECKEMKGTFTSILSI